MPKTAWLQIKMKKMHLLQEAHEQAVQVIRRCATEKGFRASGLAAGYPQIWARDNAVTALGAAVIGDPGLLDVVKASLVTLGQYQSPNGLIPLNVNPASGYISTENAEPPPPIPQWRHLADGRWLPCGCFGEAWLV